MSINVRALLEDRSESIEPSTYVGWLELLLRDVGGPPNALRLSRGGAERPRVTLRRGSAARQREAAPAAPNAR